MRGRMDDLYFSPDLVYTTYVHNFCVIKSYVFKNRSAYVLKATLLPLHLRHEIIYQT